MTSTLGAAIEREEKRRAPTIGNGRIQPAAPDYQVRPLPEGFDWGAILRHAPDEVYVVVFRSRRRKTADVDRLTHHDELAFSEAIRSSSGLLEYFQGEPTAAGDCLSFCIWRGREEARVASRGDEHRKAMRIAAEMYETWGLQRLVVRKDVVRSRPDRIHAVFEDLSGSGETRMVTEVVYLSRRGWSPPSARVRTSLDRHAPRAAASPGTTSPSRSACQ